jgi:xanthine dehydrogenase accessory factor
VVNSSGRAAVSDGYDTGEPEQLAEEMRGLRRPAAARSSCRGLKVVACGSSPVAVAIADLARRSGFAITVCAPAAEQAVFVDAGRRIEGFALPVDEAASRYVVVSTQGRSDEAALPAALAVDADYVAFVGSRKKAAALKAAFAERGVAAERLARLKAPAGLDLGAITPDEIAISILAEIVAVRRGKQTRDAE